MLECYPVLSLHGLKLCKFVSRSDLVSDLVVDVDHALDFFILSYSTACISSCSVSDKVAYLCFCLVRIRCCCIFVYIYIAFSCWESGRGNLVQLPPPSSTRLPGGWGYEPLLGVCSAAKQGKGRVSKSRPQGLRKPPCVPALVGQPHLTSWIGRT